MKLSQFKFELPLNLIAQHPAKSREESRLMVVHRDSGKIVSTRKYASSPGGKYTVADNVTYRIYDKKTGVETASYGL